jgi:Flp pilus assembly protein TadG
MHMIRRYTRALALCRLLSADRSGLALLEFAFTAPLVVALGLYGTEVANLALANLRVSQIALNLADNASRVGVQSSLVTQQLREVDINDIFAAVQTQGKAWDLTTRGRITLSSLEADSAGKQVIHWQRCIGTCPVPDTTPATGERRSAGGRRPPPITLPRPMIRLPA